MSEIFSSARIKQRRAGAHLDALRDAVKRFGDPQPYSVGRVFHDDGLGYTVVVTPTRSIEKEQEEFAGIIGDFASNARAALDHALYEIAAVDTLSLDSVRRAGALKRVQFPIFSDPDDFDGKKGNGPGIIDMLTEPHRTFIRTLQPFAAKDAKALAYLHAISNQDKHRVVHVVGVAPTRFGTNFTPRNPPPGLTINVGTLGAGIIGEQGTPLLFVRFNQPIPKDDVTMQEHPWELNAHVCFDPTSDGVAGEVAGVACHFILKSVDWVLDKLEGEFGGLVGGHEAPPAHSS